MWPLPFSVSLLENHLQGKGHGRSVDIQEYFDCEVLWGHTDDIATNSCVWQLVLHRITTQERITIPVAEMRSEPQKRQPRLRQQLHSSTDFAASVRFHRLGY